MAWNPTREYRSWQAMKTRCYNTKRARYPRYGGRGIVVCERWKESFKNFLEDMGTCPDGMTLDRKDNNGHYEPSNCQWATPRQQSRNTKRNIYLTYQGETLTVTEWGERLGISLYTIFDRLRHGKSTEEALTPSIRPWKTIPYSVRILYKGSIYCEAELARLFNVGESTFSWRVRKYGAAKAVELTKEYGSRIPRHF